MNLRLRKGKERTSVSGVLSVNVRLASLFARAAKTTAALECAAFLNAWLTKRKEDFSCVGKESGRVTEDDKGITDSVF